MDCSTVAFSGHAVRRMFERGLSETAILQVIAQGAVIEDYPHDTLYPSALLLGWIGPTPVHVVAARNPTTRECVTVTVYVPDPARWSADFRTRR